MKNGVQVRVRVGLAAMLAGLLSTGCAEPDAVATEASMPGPLGVGEGRTVQLRFTRLDVEGFVAESTLADLRRMPRRVLEDIWLADLDITPLTENALTQLRELPAEEVATLSPAVANMRTLLSLTPDNVILEGTNLEELAGLSAAVGIPTARAFGNLLEVEATDFFVPPDIVAEVIADSVIGSHPNAQTRRGPVDADHPDGRYPVAPRSIPLTMADVVTNFEDMAERFGPAGEHPGFIAAAHGVSVIEEEFTMRSVVNANALPFKGVDMSLAEVASVSSVPSQIETLHDFSRDDWLQLEGLVEVPVVEALTIRVNENPAFIVGGTAREPAGQGNGPVWDLPGWEFERLIVEMARRTTDRISAHCDDYDLATGVTAFSACIDEVGWVTLETFNDIGDPPDPSYLWDIDLELAQVRLHDGGLPEGEGDVEFTVRDLDVGVSPDELVAQVRDNVQANPEALREFATLLIDHADGDADFFYIRAEDGEDWLYFVLPEDVRLDDAGDPVRGYDYAQPGFFADEALREEVSSTAMVDGDDVHPKVRITPGDRLYAQDDTGDVFEIVVEQKPSRARLSLQISRVQ